MSTQLPMAASTSTASQIMMGIGMMSCTPPATHRQPHNPIYALCTHPESILCKFTESPSMQALHLQRGGMPGPRQQSLEDSFLLHTK